MKKTLLLLSALVFANGSLSLAATPSVSAPAATFLSIKGKVTVGKNGSTRKAIKNHKALEGETIRVPQKGNATIQLFEGSTLDLMGGSKMKLAILKQPAPNEKQIRFSLSFGSLMAHVKKLLTANSSFEVEAGGVVCGVRGTQFSVAYNATQQKVDLAVLEGSVLAQSGGQSKLVGAGGTIEFLNGKIKAPKGPAKAPFSSKNKNGNQAGGKTGGPAVLYPSNGKFIDPASLPQNPDPPPSLGLGDLNQQFVTGLSVNGNNTITNPAAGAGAKINVLVNLGPQEIVP